jgi:Fe/S biogenesis protein NfuA
MIKVTVEAQKKFSQMLKDRESGTNIRVFVEKPGTKDAECGMAFCPPSLYDMADLVYDYDDFKVIVDPLSDPYLSDAVIGVNEKDNFTLSAPSITKDFMESSLPLIDRIKFVVATEINPGIATHGGAVEIVELTTDNVLKVRFHGGCVGCSAVGATITDSLQVKLNYHFRDENIKIEDVTEHKVTDNTFQNQ